MSSIHNIMLCAQALYPQDIVNYLQWYFLAVLLFGISMIGVTVTYHTEICPFYIFGGQLFVLFSIFKMLLMGIEGGRICNAVLYQCELTGNFCIDLSALSDTNGIKCDGLGSWFNRLILKSSVTLMGKILIHGD